MALLFLSFSEWGWPVLAVPTDRPRWHDEPVEESCGIAWCGRPRYGHQYCSQHHVDPSIPVERPDIAEQIMDELKEGENFSLTTKPSKGGSYITEHGYRMVYEPTHPNASRNGYVLEHRFVMSGVRGRALRPGETVHHKDGNRLNNHPDNLELWVRGHPPGQRPKDLLRLVTVAELQEELNRRMVQE